MLCHIPNSCRDVLSLISKEFNNGKEQYWRDKANETARMIKSYLWDTKKNACYDKDKDNNTMPVLLHNNLRCMYFGSFDQEMADKFVRYHLINGKQIFSFTRGTRVVTNLKGELIEVVGITQESKKIYIHHENEYSLTVKPNTIYRLNHTSKFEKYRSFDSYMNIN